MGVVVKEVLANAKSCLLDQTRKHKKTKNCSILDEPTYRDLYSNSSDRQKCAVDVIKMWKCRAGAKLSSAIEHSGILMDYRIMYEEAATQSNGFVTDFNLQLAMSLVIARFVSDMTELKQNKPFAQPVHKVAHEKTFWSIQVRDYHDDELGGVKKKRKICQSLLSTAQTEELLKEYLQASQKHCDGQRFENRSKDDCNGDGADEVKEVLQRLDKVLEGGKRNKLLSFLVQYGYLVPVKFYVNHYGIDVSETLHSGPPKIPDSIASIWKDAIRLIEKNQLIHLLLRHILFFVFKKGLPNDDSCWLMAWFRLILLHENGNYKRFSEERASLPELFLSPIHFDRRYLLTTVLQTPNTWNGLLVPLLDDKHLTNEKLVEIQYLDQIMKGHTTSLSVPPNMKNIPQPGSSEKMIQACVEQIVLDQESCWRLITEPIDWEYVPLGVLPKDLCHSLDDGTSGSDDGGDDNNEALCSEVKSDSEAKEEVTKPEMESTHLTLDMS